MIVAYPTLSEAYTLVLYRLGKDVASNWMNDVLSGVALLNPTPEDYREAIKKLSAFADQPITCSMRVFESLAHWSYNPPGGAPLLLGQATKL